MSQRIAVACAGCAALAVAAHANTWTEIDDAGSLTGTAQLVQGDGQLTAIGGMLSGSPAVDVDLYVIRIVDIANFSASTRDFATWDTQLFLFDRQGVGVAFNDDEEGGLTFHSRLSDRFVDLPGIFFLAITRYNVDALNSGGVGIWANTPFRAERAPDGPHPGDDRLVAWNSNVTAPAGAYTIALTGAAFVAEGVVCPGDVDSDFDVDLGDLSVLLLNFGRSGDATQADGDLDGDMDVDLTDLSLLISNFGVICT
jgi:hypothetical protein